jgi:hypothetical protein
LIAPGARRLLRWLIGLLSFGWAIALSILGWLGAAGPYVLAAVAVVLLEWERIYAAVAGWWLHARPLSRRRLRAETLALVAEMRSRASQAATTLERHVESFEELSRKMEAAATDSERNAIWREHNEAVSRQSADESASLERDFGGRLRFVLNEFDRREMLSSTPSQTRLRIEWEAGSLSWLGSAASSLEALARSV